MHRSRQRGRTRPYAGRAILVLALAVAWGVPFAWSVQVTASPTLTMNPTGLTPLAGVVALATDVPSRVILHVRNGAEAWAILFPTLQKDHSVPLLGLAPGRSYEVSVTITDDAGGSLTVAPALTVATPSLPPDFPQISVPVSNPARMEPGFTLVDRFTRRSVLDGRSYSIVFDETGQVVWFGGFGGNATSWLPTGNLLYKSPVGNVVLEADLLGNVIRSIPLADPGEGLHHDVVLTEEGTFLSLTRRTTVVEDYPTSYVDPTAPRAPANVLDNPVVEFSADGGLLSIWPLQDLLDPTRIGYGSLGLEHGALDWAHANTVIVDPRDDSLLVSVRHQDAIAKFSRSTGALKWILGSHCNWSAGFPPYLLQPVGEPFESEWHPHSHEYTPAGTLLLHDNGNYRACPFDGTTPVGAPLNRTRTVEYAIDEAAMTVRQVWEYAPADAERIFSDARGDADWLPVTGNVLATYGSVSFTGGVSSPDLGLGSRYGRITEVTHTTPPEVVFDILVYDPRRSGRPPAATNELRLYRSARIPSLYPPSVSVVRAPGLTLAANSWVVRQGKERAIVVTLTNRATTTQCFAYWTDVVSPGGVADPGADPEQVCLDPLSSQRRITIHRVTPGTPIGLHQYRAYAGVYPVALSTAQHWVLVTP